MNDDHVQREDKRKPRPSQIPIGIGIEMDISRLHLIGATYPEATLGVALEYRYGLPCPSM